MALAEVGARLRLQGSAAYQRDAKKSADATGRLGKQVDKAEGSLAKMSRTVGRLDQALSGGLRAGLRGVGSAASLAAAGIGVAAIAATGLSLKFLNLATDAGETESKFRTVFGAVAADVTRFNTRISTQFGNTTKSLQDATATFGVYGQGANLAGKELVKFSTGLVQAALDLGSFYNASSEEVFGAIQSGLSGEAEPLRRYAIFLSDINLNAFAASRGLRKTTKEMTEQEKVALRGRFIMANLGKAQGDLAKTAGGLANQQRALRGRLEETGTILGRALLPGATKAATALNTRLGPAMTRLRDLAPQMEGKFSGLVDKVFKFGEAMALAFKLGGTRGLVQLLDQMTGSGGTLVAKFDEVKVILRDVIIPTGERMARVLGKAMSVVAENTRVAYIALGVYLARTKLILVAKGIYIGYNFVLALTAKRHAQQAAAAVAASATTVAASNAAAAAGVRQAVVIGNLRYAYLALGGAPVLGALGALGLAFGGLAYAAVRAQKSASNTASTLAGLPTATTGTQLDPNKPLPKGTTLNGKPVGGLKPSVEVVTNRPAVPQIGTGGRRTRAIGTGSPAAAPPIVLNNTFTVDGKVLHRSVERVEADGRARR